MTMIRFKKIAYGTQVVSDQDKALDFYTKVLDFEKRADNPTPDGPRFVTVGVKDQDFQLVLWPGKPGEGQPIGGRFPAACTIETADCRSAFEELKSRGVNDCACEVLYLGLDVQQRVKTPEGPVAGTGHVGPLLLTVLRA